MKTPSKQNICYLSVAKVLKLRDCLTHESKALSLSGSGAIHTDSRSLSKGDIFIAIKGQQFDGHKYIEQAFKAGAELIIIENPEALSSFAKTAAIRAAVLTVKCSREAWSWLCAESYQNPQEKLKIWGVTGSNGKTSCIWMLGALLEQNGINCLSIGTLGIGERKALKPSTHTSPDPPVLFEALSKFERSGGKHVIMEVSSHGIKQKKLCPLIFSALAWTSFSQDHLDFHKTMLDYWQTKWSAFENNLSKHGNAILSDSLKPFPPLENLAKKIKVQSYGSLKRKPAIDTNHIELNYQQASKHGYEISFCDEGKNIQANIPYLGKHNCENFLAAYLIAKTILQTSPNQLNWSRLPQLPGRLELVENKNPKAQPCPRVVVDFAHTPDALVKAISSLKDVFSCDIWLVFGCGGDRDKSKRPLMAKAAEEHAEQLLITSDNPRSEPAEEIAKDMLQGLKKPEDALVIHNRREAIKKAILTAPADALVLIAGKGHENFQVIGNKKIVFNDSFIAAEYLKQRL